MKALLAVTVLLVAACGNVPLAPSESATDGLRLTLSLEPDAVAVGDTLLATVTIENTRPDSVLFGAPSSCFAFIGVYRNGDRQAGFAGTDYLCLAVVSSWSIPPQDSLVHTWRVGIGTSTLTPEAGRYSLRVDFDVRPELPRLEHRFVVQ